MEQLKAFHVDDSTLYAAASRDEAAAIFHADTGEVCEDEFPTECTDTELDQQQPEFDEDERRTGGTTTIRLMLAEASPGFLASSDW